MPWENVVEKAKRGELCCRNCDKNISDRTEFYIDYLLTSLFDYVFCSEACQKGEVMAIARVMGINDAR